MQDSRTKETRLDIKSVVRLSGISQYTLRTWENRYQVVEPERTPSGRRLYSYADLNRLKIVKRLISAGHRIGTIAALSNGQLEGLLESQVGPDEKATRQTARETHHLIRLIRNYDLSGLHLNLGRLSLEINARNFVLEILLPLVQEVGRLVAEGTFSMAQEHAASFIIREQISQIAFKVPAHRGDQEGVAFATPNGDFHEIGLLIAQILCRLGGFRCHYLGASLLAEPLAEALAALDCRILVVAATSSGMKSYPEKLADFLMELRQLTGPECRIVIGGSGAPLVRRTLRQQDITQIGSLGDLPEALLR